MKHSKQNTNINPKNKILKSFLSLIKKEHLSDEKYSDILIIIKGCFNENNTALDINLIINIYKIILDKGIENQKVNNLIFINFYGFYNFIISNNHDINVIRQLLLFIETYLMQTSNNILKEQLELILFIIEDLIKRDHYQFYIIYVFLFMKILDKIITNKLYANFRVNLIQLREYIIKSCPHNDEGIKLKELLINQTI
jgi:hypothetical protein